MGQISSWLRCAGLDSFCEFRRSHECGYHDLTQLTFIRVIIGLGLSNAYRSLPFIYRQSGKKPLLYILLSNDIKILSNPGIKGSLNTFSTRRKNMAKFNRTQNDEEKNFLFYIILLIVFLHTLKSRLQTLFINLETSSVRLDLALVNKTFVLWLGKKLMT